VNEVDEVKGRTESLPRGSGGGQGEESETSEGLIGQRVAGPARAQVSKVKGVKGRAESLAQAREPGEESETPGGKARCKAGPGEGG
jgi:hypothetical protein